MPLSRIVRRLSNMSREVIVRLVAIVVMLSLSLPMVMFAEWSKTSARTIEEKPRPVSAPPEPFVVPGKKGGWEHLGERATAYGNEIKDLFQNQNLQSVRDEQSAAASQSDNQGPNEPEDYATIEVKQEKAAFEKQLSDKVHEDAPTTDDEVTEKQETAVMSPPQPASTVDFDFDGDGKADIGRWHPSTKEFKVKNSNGGTFLTVTFGSASSSAKPAPADYDNDGKTDAAVFDAGTWYIRKSSDSNTTTINSFGQSGDVPMSGDYRGDAADELVVYRPSTGYWYWREFGNSTQYNLQWGGTAGDVAAPGDFDGDGKMDWTVYRASTGYWYVLFNHLGGYTGFPWGISIDIPVQADYDDDGKTDPAVYRPSTGQWWYLKSSTSYSTYGAVGFGNPGDQPSVGDYDGDGAADQVVFRPINGRWHIFPSITGISTADSLGQDGDTAIPSSYVQQVGGGVTPDAINTARMKAVNATGGTDLYSQNFGWGRNLLSLPGRSGMDLNVGLSYNSLVWTKVGSTMLFDPDNNLQISPGFNIGFPTIEPVYVNGDTSEYSYLMVTPGGSRVEFRQTNGASNVYETADSSYAQLTTSGAASPLDPVENITIKVVTTDGTQMSYEWEAGAFRCKQVKDRNGNYITIAYDDYDQGLLKSVTDTLGRVVNFNSPNGYLSTITQTWNATNGSGTGGDHTYATLTYANKEIQTDFHSSLAVWGPYNGTQLRVLDKVTYADGSFTKFHYNDYGQVYKIEEHAADSGGTAHVLNHIRVNLNSTGTDALAADQTDVPKFTKVWNKVENFNSGNETLATISRSTAQSYTSPAGGSAITATKIEVAMSSHPHNAISKSWYGESGWKDGLPLATEDWADGSSGSERKRWTLSTYTQDDTGVAYQTNPRVTETKVGDGTNTKRTTVDYVLYDSSTIAAFGLPSTVKVYDTDQTTVLKQSDTLYNFDTNYISRRIAGLPVEVEVQGMNQLNSTFDLVSRVTYAYDEGNFSDSGLQQTFSTAPVQYDSANYGSGFAYRGNLTSTTRWDATAPTSSSITTATLKYNTAGSVVAKITPWDGTNTRTVKIGYADVWNSSGNPITYAYPTTITDPANNSSTVKYRYDIGANVEATSPVPGGQTYGKTTKRVFDSIGRLQRNSIYINNTEQSYSRYEYPSNGVQSKLYATVVDVDGDGNIQEDEAYSESWFDGAGRSLRSRVEHPNSDEGWSSTFSEYDLLGRVSRRSEPLETDAGYDWTGGDDSAGPLWKYFDYDWMGRVIRQVNTDGDPAESNDSDVLISYAGCGCAGGLVTTVQGELVLEPGTSNLRRRTQKSYADILGRTFKTESFEWDGTTPYLTTEVKFNGRDQTIKVEQTDEEATVTQTSTATFDGHGRLYQSHRPEQRDMSNNLKYATYSYNPDDSILSVTDGRGAVTNFEHNSRGLLVEKSWTVPGGSGIADPTDVTFSYDNLGNRTQMVDGMGVVNYEYNSLSQMTAEARNFTDTLSSEPSTGVYRTEYTYRKTGQLASVTEPFGETINFSNDKINRLTGVDPTTQLGDLPQNSAVVQNMRYRSFGALKQAEYGNEMQVTMAYNTRLQPSEYRLVNSSNGQTLFGKEYYYSHETGGNDGLLKSSIHLNDTNTTANNEKLDRTNEFDNVGRIKSSDSGTFDWSPFGGGTLTNGEYQMKLTYDAFGNIKSNSDRDFHYSYIGCVGCPRQIQYSETIVNNRVESADRSVGGSGQHLSNFAYDNDGRPTVRDDATHGYDASGARVSTGTGSSPTATEYFDDGDRLLIKENLNASAKVYFIRSSILNVVLLELSPSGAMKKTYVPTASGAILGFVENAEFVFVHSDPSGADTAAYKVDKSSISVADTTGIYDPLGRRRTGGAYNGGGPCIPNQTCPPGYNPPSASGYDWIGYFGGLKAQIKWQHNLLFRMEDYIRNGVLISSSGPPPDWDPYERDSIRDVRIAQHEGGIWFGGILIGYAPWNEHGLSWFTLALPGDQDGSNQNEAVDPPSIEDVEASLDRCMRKMFNLSLVSLKPSERGKNGYVTVNSTNEKRFDNLMGFGVVNDLTSFNRVQIGNIGGGGVDDGVTAMGIAPSPDGKGFAQYSPLINYTANNLTNPMAILGTQIHELGHSLAMMTGIQPEIPSKSRRPGGADSATAFEQCVFGGEVGRDGRIYK